MEFFREPRVETARPGGCEVETRQMSDTVRAKVVMAVMVLATFACGRPAAAQVLDSRQIQMLLEQAQGIEACMNRLDAEATRALRARSEGVTADIERLCKAGKRDEAQAKALAFGREMADSPAMGNLQDCVGPLGALLPAALASLNGDATDGLQVCDVQ